MKLGFFFGYRNEAVISSGQGWFNRSQPHQPYTKYIIEEYSRKNVDAAPTDDHRRSRP